MLFTYVCVFKILGHAGVHLRVLVKRALMFRIEKSIVQIQIEEDEGGVITHL